MRLTKKELETELAHTRMVRDDVREQRDHWKDRAVKSEAECDRYREALERGRKTLQAHKQHERHANHAETVYWLNQYKLLCETIINEALGK